MINFEKITKENINEIKYEDVVVFSFAEAGAMGRMGDVEIITKKNNEIKAYTTNYVFGILEKETSINAWEKEQKILFEILPILKKINFNTRIIRGHGHIEDWAVFDMGMGNHLIVRDYLDKQILEKYENAKLGEMYQSWKEFIETIL